MSEYAVVNPATGETGATYDTFTDAQVEQALTAAQAGFETWRHVPVAERAAIVRRAAELHRERREVLADIIVREMGKVKAGALGEVDGGEARSAAGEAVVAHRIEERVDVRLGGAGDRPAKWDRFAVAVTGESRGIVARVEGKKQDAKLARIG